MSGRDRKMVAQPGCHHDVYAVTQHRRKREEPHRLAALPEGAGSGGQEKSSRGASVISPWRLVPVVLIAAAFAAFFILGLDRYLSFETLRDNRDALVEWRSRNTLFTGLAFIAGYALAVALSLPGAVWMTIAAGFLFGPVVATIYVVIAATLGATAIFLAARYAFSDLLRAKAGRAVRKMEAGFRENALSYLLALRLVPIFPFWLVNLVPAFLGVPLRTFVIGTFFGIIPGSIVYTLVGNGLGAVLETGGRPDLGLIFSPEILAPILGLALLSLLPVAYKGLRRRSGRSHRH